MEVLDLPFLDGLLVAIEGWAEQGVAVVGRDEEVVFAFERVHDGAYVMQGAPEDRNEVLMSPSREIRFGIRIPGDMAHEPVQTSG